MMRLNLGCGDHILSGYINHDFTRHRAEVDVTHDLRVLPWPWADDSAEETRLLDVLEHLPEVVPIIDECWRVLKPGGVLYIRVPHYQHENAWLDPTHRRPFHPNSFDYFDPETEWGAKYGFYTQRKWKVERREVQDGNVAVVMRSRKGVIMDWTKLSPHSNWEERVARTAQEIAAVIPPEEVFILVDQAQFGTEITAGRRALPFIEQNGQYWGLPADDDTAIRELERLRQSGASFIVFAWPSFWWLDYYSGLHRYLCSEFKRILDNERIIAFDMRTSVSGLLAEFE